MNFKGRTVALIVGITITVSSLATMAIMDLPIFASSAGQPSSGSLTVKEQQKVNAVLQVIQKHYFKEIDRTKLIDGAINGIFTALDDPYSTYMQREEAENFNVSVEGGFTGIGAEVSMEDGKVTIVSPIKDTPAERAGLKPKDVLLTVDGVSLEGLNLNQAVDKIRGPRGSKVKLEVKRPGVEQVMTFEITRDKVDLETVFPTMLGGKIGYIEIRQFSTNTYEHFITALDGLEKQGMKGLILDVRNNPGGVLDIVEKMTSPFIQKGKPLLQVEYRDQPREVHKSKGTDQPKPYPIAILTNKGSASASEIMASALQESAGVKIVGEHTFGKGTVQTSFPDQEDGSLIKITIAKWLTPNGNWIHQKGIEPDVPVAQPDYFNAAPIAKDKLLKKDMNAADVKNLQVILSGLGYKLDRKDGYFSASTEQAVKAFQKEKKLAVTGQVDSKTAEQLELSIVEVMRDKKNDAQLNAAIKTIQKEIQP